jgi:adenylate cyclase
VIFVLATCAAIAVIVSIILAVVLRNRARLLQLRVGKLVGELESLQRAFSRFAPPTVVDEIAAGQSTAASGDKREVTVLFADLQGFTTLAEGLDAAVLVEILNGYFAEMTRVIAAHHGLVSKFIGDGLMATFGAVSPNPWQARDAAEAALGMRAALAGYNEKLRAVARPELKFGVGVHRGVVVAGLIGCEALTEFTVIGDVVNVASRVEGLTRSLGTDILVTEEVRAGLDDRFKLEAMPAKEVKGRTQPVVTWALRG